MIMTEWTEEGRAGCGANLTYNKTVLGFARHELRRLHEEISALPTETDSQHIIDVYSNGNKMMCVDPDGDIELEGMRGQFNGPIVK